MTDKGKVNYSYIRRVASDLVEESLSSAGYKDRTVSYIRDSLLAVISSETEIDSTTAKNIQNQLLVHLDGEPSALEILGEE
jgi:hypothetical protein